MNTDRRGYYLKPGVRVTAPGSLFVVTVNSIDQRDQPRENFGYHEFYRGYVCHTTYRRGKWSALVEASFSDPLSLHKWIIGYADAHRRNYLVCPVASDVLTLTRFWEFADKAGIAWAPRGKSGRVQPVKKGRGSPLIFRRLVLKGRPDIVHYRHREKTYVWLSGAQYFPEGPPSIPAAIPVTTPPIESNALPPAPPIPDHLEMARRWCRGIMGLADWWRKEARAPWGMTAGQLSLGMLRSSIRRGDLCSHNDADTHRLERLAQHGGRASLFFTGSIGQVPDTIPPPPKLVMGRPAPGLPGPAVLIDCRSMYPFLLRDNVYPVKLIGTGHNPPAAEPQALARSVGVIARVLIRTDWPEFPRRHQDRVTFPAGEFVTTLTGPELLALKGRGEVLKCHQLAVYQVGRPFAPVADRLLTLRADARRRGDDQGELFAKLLANSMGGKLAQKKGSWMERRHQLPEREWGEFYTASKDGRGRRRFRSIGGLVWEWVPDKSSAGPFGAAFSYLTAYGRLHMAHLRELCPPRTVYSQDTDGLWVHPSAVSYLKRRKVRFGDEPGQLRVQEMTRWARFWGPRHYVTDAGWILSGFYQPTVDPVSLTVIDTHAVNPVAWSPDEPPTSLVRERRVSTLKAEIHGGKVDPFGWVQPHHLKRRYTSG